MFLRAIYCLAACLLIGVEQQAQADLDSTIPVVDMRDFYNPTTKQQFVDQVSQALHEVGFFAVVNPDIDQEALEKGYAASRFFFNSPLALKNEIHDPALNGQRGYVHSEKAQGYKAKDHKEFIHIGKNQNLWPAWMDLKTPMEGLMAALDKQAESLERAFALAIGEEEEFFVKMTREGECLLRTLHYPANPAEGVFWAAKHTDIDLFTILPVASEEGLQIFHEGKWINVVVPPNAFIVNGGDKMQNLTNGFFKSALHQVVSKPNCERFSIVYFIHQRLDDPCDPTAKCIAMTGGVQRYPNATSLELLACRLRELGLASPSLLEFESKCGIMDRVKALVDAGVAAPPVQLTYDIWMKSQSK